jgi:LPS export ABC transporter protein LptC
MLNKRLVFLGLILLSSALFLFMRLEKTARMDIQLSGNSFFEGLKIVNKKDGATAWVLHAKRADLSEDGKEAHLNGVEMNMASQGITVEAEKGLYNMETRQVSIEGAIRAHNENYTITSSQAVIDTISGTIETDDDIMIEGKKFNLKGKGMKADNNEQKVRILNNVKAVFNR